MTGAGPITVLVPAADEADDIEACIAAIAAQDVGADRVDLIVVDGASRDGTGALAEAAARQLGITAVRVLHNPRRTTPTSLNVGLAAARGDLLCRVDARSIIPAHYLRRCEELLADRSIAVVGGAQVAEAASGAGVVARALARANRNPYATGFSRYRLRRASGPADTVYLGAFRTANLRAVGGWDERFTTNQDYELNRRMAIVGTVWFAADLAVGYRPRASFGGLARQQRRFGRWKAAAWTEQGMPVAPRQVALLVGPPLVGIVAAKAMRRHPIATMAAGLAVAAAVDSADREPAGPGERLVSMVAMGTTAACWWAGVVEQVGRRFAGGRLLDSSPVS